MNLSGTRNSQDSLSNLWHWCGYVALLISGLAIFLLIRNAGESLAMPSSGAGVAVGVAGTSDVASAPKPMAVDVVFHVIATLTAVIGVGYVLGRLCRYIGQPPVIGEVIAGILLGPSLLGAISPEAMHWLIPDASLDRAGQVPAALKAISQLGVILYMFLVGLELNGAQLRGKTHAAITVSHTSIVVPFVLGSALALGLFTTLAQPGVSFTNFSLFMGVAMSVTAFPVLARILSDRKLDKTPLGTLALACAAADDVTAWCLLALVVGIAQSQLSNALYVAIYSAGFILAMLVIVKPLLERWTRKLDSLGESLPPMAVTLTFIMILASALTTEAIGIHAVFGAFLLGAIVPSQSRLATDFLAKLKDPVTVLLLPAFFAFTGMRTQITLVSTPSQWLICAAIIAVATLGKFGGTLAAARLTGHNWRDSAALGALMNTRGLMELIVLNIGLDLGIISPTLFAMMVLMALGTTIMTSPILQWLLRKPDVAAD